MPRHPIGDRAMTDAERQRRRRERLRQKKPNPLTKAQAEALKERVRVLEAELAQERAKMAAVKRNPRKRTKTA